MLPRIFCLIDETNDLSLLPRIARCGVGGFQVRAKALSDRDLAGLTSAVMAAVQPFRATVIVNDRIDIALAAAADGVHLGSTDLPIAAARRIAPHLVIGATCRSVDEVRRAADAGADYAGFGPIFATTSKADLPAPLGIGAIGAAAGVLPLVAIGGVGPAEAARVLAAGAASIAVIGSIWRHPDPLTAARNLVSAVA